MNDPFALPLSGLSVTETAITAAARVDAGSQWYDGHFPGQPILPGMGIIALVKEAIVAAECRQGNAVTITGMTRVRFRLPVRPGEAMEIRITRPAAGGGRYPFVVSLAGEAVCSGILEAVPAPQTEQIS